MSKKMAEISDEDIEQIMLAGQIMLLHRALTEERMSLSEAAALMRTDSEYLIRQFDRLGLVYKENELTFEEMLEGAAPKEQFYTAEDIRRIFFNENE